jgi:hypothetical protein
MFKALKYIFSWPTRAVEACVAVAEASRAQTAELQQLRRDLGTISAESVLQHQQVIFALSAISDPCGYLAIAKKAELRRAGHKA